LAEVCFLEVAFNSTVHWMTDVISHYLSLKLKFYTRAIKLKFNVGPEIRCGNISVSNPIYKLAEMVKSEQMVSIATKLKKTLNFSCVALVSKQT